MSSSLIDGERSGQENNDVSSVDSDMDSVANSSVSPAQVDKGALDAIESAVSRLRNSERRMSDRETWDYTGGSPPLLHGDATHRAAWVTQAKNRIQELQRVKTSLDEIQRSAFTLQRDIQYGLTLMIGLLRLPDEILIHILMFDLGENGYFKGRAYHRRLCELSSVCRRFRTIIRSTPVFWTNISDTMGPYLVDQYLVLSKDAGISIKITKMEDDTEKTYRFVSKVLRCCHRWQSLSIRVSRIHEASRSSLFTRLSLPRLSVLEYTYDLRDTEIHAQLPGKVGGSNQLYRSWALPNLRHFTSYNITPRSFASPGPFLTSCSINLITGSWNRPDEPLGTLIEFLQSQPALEHLSITCKKFPQSRWGTEYLTSPEHKRLRLPCLRKLEILGTLTQALSDIFPEVSAYVVMTLLRCLEIPSVATMAIRLPVAQDDFALEDIFPLFNDYNAMEDLTLMLNHRPRRVPPLPLSPFRTVFQRLRNLKRFTLEAGTSRLEGILPSDPTYHTCSRPPLEVLRVYNCTSLPGDALVTALQYLCRGEHWSKFRFLHVTNSFQVTGALYAFAGELGLSAEQFTIDSSSKNRPLIPVSSPSFPPPDAYNEVSSTHPYANPCPRIFLRKDYE